MTKTAKGILWVIALVIVVLIIVNVSSKGGKNSNTASSTPIKIGFTGPLTGDVANIGQNAKAAVEIAVGEINSAGGINGRQIEMVYEDDRCAGPEGVKAANKLINVDNVTAILGSVCSPATLSFAPIAEKAQTPVLSYCSTAPKISESGDYIFRDVPSDLFQAGFAAKYTYNTLGKRKVAIINVNNDWGLGLKKAFSDAFKALGGQVVLEDGDDPTSKDLRTQMAKVKSSGADLLYFAGFPDGTVAGLKEAKTLKLTQTIFGADAWDDNKIWDSLGSSADGVMYTRVGTNSSDAFKTKMKEKLGNDSIVYCSNYAYDGLKILADAIKTAGTDRTAVKNALYSIKHVNGVSSSLIEFDANGDPKEANYVIDIIKNGKAEIVK